jgi:hypothetical protein
MKHDLAVITRDEEKIKPMLKYMSSELEVAQRSGNVEKSRVSHVE